MKSFRALALVAALTLAAAPSAFAGQTGCNPRPYAVPVSPIVSIVLSVIGL